MRQRLPLIAALAAVAVAGTVAVAVLIAPRVEDRLRRAAIATLEERFDSTVEFHAMHVRLFPRVRIDGGPLMLRKRNQPESTPLIRLDRFSGCMDGSGSSDRASRRRRCSRRSTSSVAAGGGTWKTRRRIPSRRT